MRTLSRTAGQEVPTRRLDIRHVLVVFACVLAIPSSGAEHDDPCDKASSQIEINACSAERYARADRQMNEVYRKLQTRLRGKKKDLFTRAQKAWLRFRDIECELESSGARGGSAYSALHNECLTRLTTARTDDLKRLVQDM